MSHDYDQLELWEHRSRNQATTLLRWAAGSRRLSGIVQLEDTGPMFTPDDLALLSRPLYATVTAVPGGDRLPAPRPVWFVVAEGGRIEMFASAGSPRVRRFRADPRASLVVAAPVGEPERWVAAEGSVSLHADGARALAQDLSKRYWFPGIIDDWSEHDLVRIVFTPHRVRRFAA